MQEAQLLERASKGHKYVYKKFHFPFAIWLLETTVGDYLSYTQTPHHSYVYHILAHLHSVFLCFHYTDKHVARVSNNNQKY